jgi:hypothetical protein
LGRNHVRAIDKTFFPAFFMYFGATLVVSDVIILASANCSSWNIFYFVEGISHICQQREATKDLRN